MLAVICGKTSVKYSLKEENKYEEKRQRIKRLFSQALTSAGGSLFTTKVSKSLSNMIRRSGDSSCVNQHPSPPP